MSLPGTVIVWMVLAAVLVLTVESVVLWRTQRRHASGLFYEAAANLAAGFLLLVAVGAVALHLHWGIVGLLLALSGVAHAIDMKRRCRRI